jgi:hypothetical protein
MLRLSIISCLLIALFCACTATDIAEKVIVTVVFKYGKIAGEPAPFRRLLIKL